ncbi:hypothetical protein H4R33_001251 [Dimargaris cristalligena]|uniref:Acyl-CoA N-acyltransferase n=1 Tax=Dimargaris cristalligena TaxID=215637 RepID=A0A4V1J4M3_9FUNG|nr:hypothetical protein H4R33_001251 [Dimargaris cristalligena]RKP36059.1 acyl-CoA N-acyltransferase [Dimargaris cristalligena]|eukprot:RKP36059.1 acyl-CoA N-acyltransferase [Dimargaris cristalligena]
MAPSAAYDVHPVDDVEAAYQLELRGFPASEASSRDTLVRRHQMAPHFCIGAYTRDSPVGRLVGFTSATASQGDTLTHAAMYTHDPEGTTVNLHSVCVDPDYQRRGIASLLLKELAQRLRALNQAPRSTWPPGMHKPYRCIRLIAHQPLFPLYQANGYTLIGRSSVEHGKYHYYIPYIKLNEFGISPPYRVNSVEVPWPSRWDSSTLHPVIN